MTQARHRPTPQRRLPPAVWIAPVALVALGAVLFLVLRAGSSGGGIFGGGQDNSIPAFDFTLTKAIPIPVTNKDAKQFTAAAKEVARQVDQTMTTLYTEAFLDPANWRGGSYDRAWSLFDGGSQAAAQQDGATLTLGTTAGDRFDTVDQPKGYLAVKVLLDKDDKPATAVAIVKFQALAAGKDGTYTMIVSTGQYFLRAGSGGWRIYSFSVSRGDHETVPKPGPSGSPTAVAS